jgi:hypothetical protein
MTGAHLAAWLAAHPGVVEVGLRVPDLATLPPEVRDALRTHKPLAMALLLNDVLDRGGDTWTSYRGEVDNLQAGGLTRADALRHAYARRFKIDPGPIDPAALDWLWEGV